MNKFTKTITVANLVDSLTPLIKSKVRTNTIKIAGTFIETGITPNKYGITSCGFSPCFEQIAKELL